jgi:hypothetical protein
MSVRGFRRFFVPLRHPAYGAWPIVNLTPAEEHKKMLPSSGAAV